MTTDNVSPGGPSGLEKFLHFDFLSISETQTPQLDKPTVDGKSSVEAHEKALEERSERFLKYVKVGTAEDSGDASKCAGDDDIDFISNGEVNLSAELETKEFRRPVTKAPNTL